MHSCKSKPIIRIAAFLCVLCLTLSLINFALSTDNTYTRIMMHELYTQNEPIDFVFIGASITYRHFDPQIWDETLGMNTFNAGSSSQTPDASYYLMKEIFKTQSPRYVIFGTSYVSFMDLEDYDNPQKDFILFDYFKPSLNKVAYGIHAFDNADKLLGAILPFMRERNIEAMSANIALKTGADYKTYSPTTVNNNPSEQYMGKGFVYCSRQKEKGMVGKLSPYIFSADKIDSMKTDYFAKLVMLCKQHDCELIMVVTPIPYASMELQDNYSEICAFYRKLAEENDIALFDFSLSRPELFNPIDSDFYDDVHMNGEAAKRFSAAASSVILKYISGQPVESERLFFKNYKELLDSNQTIYNAWIEQNDNKDYVAFCTHGANMPPPEYRFSYRVSENDEWILLKAYSEEAFLPFEKVAENATEILLEVRVKGSDALHQQRFVFSK